MIRGKIICATIGGHHWRPPLAHNFFLSDSCSARPNGPLETTVEYVQLVGVGSVATFAGGS